jgi:hypothetical protein
MDHDLINVAQITVDNNVTDERTSLSNSNVNIDIPSSPLTPFGRQLLSGSCTAHRAFSNLADDLPDLLLQWYKRQNSGFGQQQ